MPVVQENTALFVRFFSQQQRRENREITWGFMKNRTKL